MSLELKEFRGKITAEADAVISSAAESSGREKQEIVREILHDYALRKLHEFKLLGNHLEREGLSGIVKEQQGVRSRS